MGDSSSQTRPDTPGEPQPPHSHPHPHHCSRPWLVPQTRRRSHHSREPEKTPKQQARPVAVSPLRALRTPLGRPRPGAPEAQSRCLPRPARLPTWAGPTESAGPVTDRPRLPASCGASQKARSLRYQSWSGRSGSQGSFCLEIAHRDLFPALSKWSGGIYRHNSACEKELSSQPG